MRHQPADVAVARCKCAQCGLVNFAVNETCRRCGAALSAADDVEPQTAVEPVERHGVRRRVLWLIVTLYPAFFEVAVDDTERAAILLHESQHLLGFGEEAALERVWREKQRLGWTADNYVKTRVWRNVREWTGSSVPALFQCGADGHSDCMQ